MTGRITLSLTSDTPAFSSSGSAESRPQSFGERHETAWSNRFAELSTSTQCLPFRTKSMLKDIKGCTLLFWQIKKSPAQRRGIDISVLS
jgi:hypothetical protein